MRTRADLKQTAKNALKGNWGLAIAAVIIIAVISGVFSSILQMFFPKEAYPYSDVENIQSYMYFTYSTVFAPSQLLLTVLAMLVINPLSFGLQLFFLEISKNGRSSLDLLFVPYKNILKIFLVSLIISIFTYIGFLFLIIPGIIIALMLSMVPFIMVEDPGVGVWDAVKRSAAMTKGYKMDLFVLGLSFLGWIILGAIPCGIGLLWVMPYMNVTYANFYLDLKLNNYQEPAQA